MRDNYKFVYSLVYKGNVFYIGCAKDVISRYKQHLMVSSIHSGPSLRKKMSEILEEGAYPDLNILGYLPEAEAFSLEDTIIDYFSLSGHSICNERRISYFCKQAPEGMPENPSLGEQIAAIKYKVDTWIYRKNCPHNPWKPSPSSPFKAVNEKI